MTLDSLSMSLARYVGWLVTEGGTLEKKTKPEFL